MKSKTATTPLGDVEVISLFRPVENTGAFSCENDCVNCMKTCEIGVINKMISIK